MRYVAPKYPRIELTTEEYEILDNARKLLADMRENLVNDGVPDDGKFVVYDECTDMDSTAVFLSDLNKVTIFLNDIV